LYFSFAQQWPYHSFEKQELIELFLCGVLVLPLQIYTFARLGIYQGLAQGNSLRATFTLIAKVGLLPWGLFMAVLFSLLISDRFINRWLSANHWFGEAFIFGCWIAIHLAVCLGFLLHGNWRLRRHFRALASQTVKPPWWKRLRVKKPAS